MHFVFRALLFFSRQRDFLLFQFPIRKRLPIQIQKVVSAVVQLLFLSILVHLSRSVFLLLMEEFSQVTQFFPMSGGMNDGFNPPPVPDNSPILAAALQEAEGQPGPSTPALHQDENGRRILYKGMWDKIAAAMQYEADKEGLVRHYHISRWQACLKKIVPKEGNDYISMSQLLYEVRREGKDHSLFKEVLAEILKKVELDRKKRGN